MSLNPLGILGKMSYNPGGLPPVVGNFAMDYLSNNNNDDQSNSVNSYEFMKNYLADPEMLNYVRNVLSGDLDFQRTLELQQRQFDYNSLEAQRARDEYRALSDTAYQRAVKDLKAAGLNPALAATAGLGASAYAVQSSGASGSFSLGSQGSQILSSVLNNLSNLTMQQMKNLASLLSSVIGVAGRVAGAAIAA